MSIIYDSSVSGVNTPSAITGVIADRPAANTAQDGTVFISTDTQEIFSAQGGSWVSVSGGGGGSQNLDQVLAVGDTGTNKNITLTGVTGSQISLVRPNFSTSYINPYGISSLTQANNLRSEITLYNQPSINIVRLWIRSFALPQVVNTEQELDYQADNNGKNQFVIRKLNGTANDYRRFVVNASYSGGNSVEISEANSTNYLFVKSVAQLLNGIAFTLCETSFAGVIKQGVYSDQSINFVSGSQQIILNPSFGVSSITVNLPQFSGIMANVNERIVDNNVDLSAGSYPCAAYGVYVVNVGDNTNTFDLDTFVGNGADGQFVTICANDTPIKCTNTAGNFIGTANINSKGLYKLMKIGNDIYSSHI